MQLTDNDREFIDRRRRLIRWWPLALLLMVVLLAGTCLFLFIRHPLLANPYFVFDAVQAGTLPLATLQLAAVFLPVVFCLLYSVIAVMLLLLHVTIRNERHYQAIIGKTVSAVSDS